MIDISRWICFDGIPNYAKRSGVKRDPFIEPGGVRSSGFWLDSILLIRNQGNFGSCVGQALGSALSELLGSSYSARFLWVEGRRHGLDLSGKDDGTNYDCAIWAVENVGLPPYDNSENDNTSRNWYIASFGPDLRDELSADDKKPVLNVTSISPQDPNAFGLICAAIESGKKVCFASGLLFPFFSLESGDVATSRHLGGGADGHAQKFCGFDRAAGHVFVLNSWGNWAGLIVPKSDIPDPAWPGRIDRGNSWELPGAYRMDKTAIANLWEIHVIDAVK